MSKEAALAVARRKVRVERREPQQRVQRTVDKLAAAAGRLARAVEPRQNENPVKDGSDRQRSLECRQLSVDAGLVRWPNPNRILVDDIVRGRATEVAVCIIRTTTSVATRARTTTRV